MPKMIDNDEFIETWRRLRSPIKVAKHLQLSQRNVYDRRRRIEMKLGISLESDVGQNPTAEGDTNATARRLTQTARDRARKYERDMTLEIINGVVLVASDCHYWPGVVTVAHQALCKLAKQLKPEAVVLNGDVLDGARVSRHARIMWEKLPELKDEIAAVQDRCAELERAAGMAQLIRTIGNHDARFENYLSAHAPDLEEMTGSTLIDYLPRWRAGWALHVNQSSDAWTTIRHRPVSGGVHSAYNSTLRSGVHYVHGHLHKLQVTPWGDYRGRRYGVDTGTLAEPNGPQFGYTEAGPLNWASGFAVLTFHGGKLLQPELVVVHDGAAWFRGRKVGT
jgi:hypothetical protein